MDDDCFAEDVAPPVVNSSATKRVCVSDAVEKPINAEISETQAVLEVDTGEIAVVTSSSSCAPNVVAARPLIVDM